MNQVRVLPPDEWHRLLELPGQWLKHLPDESEAVVFAVEDHLGDIIGFWMVLQVYHLEPVWIRPDHRGGLVPRRLWRRIRQFLDSCSIVKAFCLTEKVPVADYLSRLGFEELADRTFRYSCHKTPTVEEKGNEGR
jgi:N-acetylglutamate synthase-like GNAT family acetyltransferase